MDYQCLTGPLFHAFRTHQTWMTKWVPKNNGSHLNMSILTTCPICDKVIFIRAEIMGRTQCCQRVTHITDMFTKSDQGTIAQRCLSQKTVLPIMFLVMPSESHYVWTLVDPSLAIPFSSDTIDTLIPAILLYGSYKITRFLIKHFFLRATGIGWLRGNDQRWTSIPSRGSRNTPSRFMLQKPGISSSSYDPAGSKASFFFLSQNHSSCDLGSAAFVHQYFSWIWPAPPPDL